MKGIQEFSALLLQLFGKSKIISKIDIPVWCPEWPGGRHFWYLDVWEKGLGHSSHLHTRMLKPPRKEDVLHPFLRGWSLDRVSGRCPAQCKEQDPVQGEGGRGERGK